MPSARRLTTIVGAAFVGLAATAMFASPASATTATVTGTAVCQDNGTYKITWTITSDYPRVELTITDVQVNPKAPLSKDLNGEKIKGKPAFRTVTQEVPGTTKKAELSFHPLWSNGHEVDRYKGEVSLNGKCAAKPECPSAGNPGGNPVPPNCPTPSKSTSPSPSGGSGGGVGSPDPSKSATTPALPVTGAQTGILTGGALALVGAGAGLFFMARRRRVKFEA